MASSSSKAAVIPKEETGSDNEIMYDGKSNSYVKPMPLGYESSDVESGERSSDMDDDELDVFLMGGEEKRKKKKGQQGKGGQDEKAIAAVPKKKRRKKTLATATAKGVSQKAKDLMGKANVAFMQGDYHAAAESLLLVVQEAPGLAEPFHTLGVIHEEWGNMKKSEEFFLLAVHLTPNDAGLWKRVANVAKSRGDLAQAAYCLRRCLRNCQEDENMADEIMWDLASIHMTSESPKRALRYLEKLYERRPDDNVVAKELAKVYHGLKRREDCCKVLEKMADASKEEKEVPADLLHMLGQVYVEMREYEKCYKLLDSLGTFTAATGLQTIPPEIVSHAAICSCHLNKQQSLIASIDALRNNHEMSDIFDLVLNVVDALFERDKKDLALAIMQEIVQEAPELQDDPAVQIRLGKACHAKEQYEEAAKWLTQVLQAMKEKTIEQDPATFVLFSECMARLGRSEEADEALMSLSYRDLQASATLPEAISADKRLDYYDKLNKLLAIKVDGKPLLHQKDNVRAKIHRREFVTLFSTLIRDCELDVARVKQQRLKRQIETEQANALKAIKNEVKDEIKEDPNDKKLMAISNTKDLKTTDRKHWNFSSLMMELGLVNIEDKVGTKVFIDFLQAGIDIFRIEEKYIEAVELVETILRHRRKTTKTDYANKAESFDRLMRICLEIGVDSGMRKVSLKNLRNLIANDSAMDKLLPEHIVAFYGRVLFCNGRHCAGVRGGTDGAERDFAIRKLIRQPQSFALTMLAGHFCVTAGKYPLSVAEYLRAYSMSDGKNPHNVLCLAAAYMSFAMSRTVQHRHTCIAKGIAMMYEYIALCEREPEEGGREEAEWTYNLGHCYHQISVYHLAVPLYERCLRCLDRKKAENDGKEEEHLQPLRTSAAQNLSLIFTACGNLDAARTVLMKNIVF